MIEEVKQYLRLDGSEEDTFLASLIDAAKLYIKNATDVEVDESIEFHKLAIKLLIAHWYENREVIGKADKLAFGLDSILQQIQFSGGTV